VTAGVNPPSTGLAVTGDLSNLGGGPGTVFYDDGSNGDVTAGGNVFFLRYNVPFGPKGGGKLVSLTVTHGEGGSGNGTATVNVTASTNEAINGTVAPNCGGIGSLLTLTSRATGFGCPSATLVDVTVDCTTIDGGSVVLHDDGVAPDVTAGD